MQKCGHYSRFSLGGLVLLLSLGWSTQGLAQGPQAVVVETAPVRQQTIAQPVTFVGTVEPLRRSQVASEVAGMVSEWLVDEGQLVRQGEALLKLRQERLKIILQARRASANRYREELAELKNGSRPEEVEEARAAVQEAEAELAQARREQGRQRDLSTRGVASTQSSEDAETQFHVAQKRLTRAKKRYQLVVQGPRDERISGAEAQYQAAQAEVQRIQYDLNQSTVTAPFSGFVITKHTESGQWLDPGDPVVTLIELSTARITVPIPERYAAHVKVGRQGLVKLDAFPDRNWKGVIAAIIPQATESRNFPVVVDVPNPDAEIKSGAFARVTLTVGEQQNVLLVPKDAVVTQGPRQIVYAIREGKASPVPIQRRTFHGGSVVVSGPLKPGEPVVIRGNERLRPGQAVRAAQGKL